MSPNCLHTRLDFSRLGVGYFMQLHSIVFRSSQQFFKPDGRFMLSACDHKFAASIQSDLAVLAESSERCVAISTEASLQ
jgi:hypothetical protein